MPATLHPLRFAAPLLLGLLLVLSATPAVAHAGSGIAAENALPGTADWQLTNPATNREIEGYASATSVDRGDPIALKVSTAAPAFTLEVFRTGWYQGRGARRVAGPVTVGGQYQLTPSPDRTTGLVDANWATSYTLRTRDAQTGDPWPTGVYLARLTEARAGKQAYILFVVRDDARRPDILFQLPVTTYQAYNFWGGRSLYPWGSGTGLPWGTTSGTAATKVSFDRPYAGSTNPAAAFGTGAGEYLTNVQRVAQGFPISSSGWDYGMVRWLERHGYDVGYITNIDTHESASLVRDTNVFLSQGHDEYWTWQMRSHVEGARDAGTNLAFFSGNTAYWQIRLEPSPSTGAPDRVIVGYKSAATDPYALDADPSNDRYVTVRFRDPPVKWPEAEMKGSQYVTDPVDGDITISSAANAVFDGTGLADGQTLRGLLGYEVDRMADASPAGTVSLAHSPISRSTGQFSDMTIFTTPGGARVFGTGTIQWSWGLDDFGAPTLRTSRLSAEAATITANVLRVAGARPTTQPLALALAVPAQGAATAVARPVFTWHSGGDDAATIDHYELWIDGGASGHALRGVCTGTTCSAPAPDALADGSHTWLVKAQDAGGELWSTASRTLTVDTTPPAAFALRAPADGAATASARPTLSWQASSDSGTGLDHYDVLLDGRVLAGSRSAASTSFAPSADLPDGTHTWTVRAVDAVGNMRTAGARTLTIATTPPQTQIDARPPAVTVRRSARITFGSPDAAAAFSCRIDGGGWATCVSPLDLAGLADGAHRVEVRATDAVGNVDPTPATADWTIDTTTPPTARLTAKPNPVDPSDAVLLDAAASEDHADGALVAFSWDLDGDGTFETSTGSAATVSTSFAAPGAHTVGVRVTDDSGRSAVATAQVDVRSSAPGALTPTLPPAGAAGASEVLAAPRAGQGLIVFSRRDASGAWRLWLRRSGAADGTPVDLAPSEVPFDADVGTDGRGRPVIVLSRCRGTAAQPTGCRIHLHRLDRAGGEVPVRETGDSRWNDVHPTISEGVLAWTREVRHAGRPVPAVYVRRLSSPAGTPSRRVAEVRARRCAPGSVTCAATTRRTVTGLELAGTRLAILSAFDCAGCVGGGRRELRILDLANGSRRLVAAVPRATAGLLGPSLLPDAIGWYRTCAGVRAACAHAGAWRLRFRDGVYLRERRQASAVAGFADLGERLIELVCPTGGACRIDDVTAPDFAPAHS